MATDGFGLNSIANADLNRDGIEDLITGSSGVNINVWIGNGDGTLQPLIRLAIAVPTSNVSIVAMASADLNRDGRADFRGHLAGRVAYVAMINPARGQRLRELFAQARWDEDSATP